MCPRCGSTGDEAICQPCDLQRLYPDPKANRGRYEQAHLSGLYARVYRAFARVMAGNKTLDYLWPRLEPLDDHLETLIDTVQTAVKKGDAVQLVGFGTFKSAKRAARSGKNPSTGAALKIPAATVPKFVAGAKFKAVVDPKAAKRKAEKAGK